MGGWCLIKELAAYFLPWMMMVFQSFKIRKLSLTHKHKHTNTNKAHIDANIY